MNPGILDVARGAGFAGAGDGAALSVCGASEVLAIEGPKTSRNVGMDRLRGSTGGCDAHALIDLISFVRSFILGTRPNAPEHERRKNALGSERDRIKAAAGRSHAFHEAASPA
jgi:hypothetical protein